MKTPEMWLEEVLNSKAKMHHWLQRQYVGECLAFQRMTSLSKKLDLTLKEKIILEKIAGDEDIHSRWIQALLSKYEITIPYVSYNEDRYWKATLKDVITKDHLFAIGHHAEAMRLRQIRLLCSDKRVPEEIQAIFTLILKDETFHAKAFKQLASKEALKEMSVNHKAGLEALGLEL